MSLTYLYYTITDSISQYKFLIICFKERKNYLSPLLSFTLMIMNVVIKLYSYYNNIISIYIDAILIMLHYI